MIKKVIEVKLSVSKILTVMFPDSADENARMKEAIAREQRRMEGLGWEIDDIDRISVESSHDDSLDVDEERDIEDQDEMVAGPGEPDPEDEDIDTDDEEDLEEDLEGDDEDDLDDEGEDDEDEDDEDEDEDDEDAE